MAFDEVLAERLRERLVAEEGVSERKMFGGLAFLVHGRLAVTANRLGGLMVRCPPADTDRHVAEPGVARYVMRGREMDGWLGVDPSVIGTDEQLDRWVDVGVEFARSLTPR